ncbi:phage tail protein [Metabacillus sp. Hm71]|uniref:phage tail protein n=1 Tax=Metabacillus sp. Hm71 TaxID=3450743 RepID=UPI003F438FEE
MSDISFAIEALDRFTKPMKDMEKATATMSAVTSSALGQVTSKTEAMSREIYEAFSSSKETMRSFKDAQIEVAHGYLQLTKNADQYLGKTGEFINQIEALGKKNKKITDQMVAQNEIYKMSFYESVGDILARSTQSEKIAANFERMGNPLYTVNNGLLNISGSLEKVAKSGNPAVLAIQQLGSNASLKDLQDHVRLINQGILRMGAVAVASAVVFGIATAKIIDRAYAVNDALAPLTDNMKSTWATVFDPLAEVIGTILEPVIQFATKIGEMINKFNEAHPVLAKMIQSFMYLFSALMLILSPLAVGIGLFGGLKAALFAAWTIIAPFVTGFAAVAGTAAVVAAGIVAVVAAIWYLYNRFAWFRDAVGEIWDGIKTGWNTAVSFIQSVTKSVMSAVTAFVGEQLDKISAWWDKHGTTVMAGVDKFMKYIGTAIDAGMQFIKGVFQVVFPIIQGIVEIAWAFISNIIDTAIDVILGIIEVGMALLEGDWESAWTAIEGIATDIMDGIIGFFEDIDLFEIGKDIIQGLIDGIANMAGAVAKQVSNIASSIPEGVKKLLGIHSPSRVLMELGGFTTEGFAVGMMDMIKSVGKATNKIAAAAVPSIDPEGIRRPARSSQSLNAESITSAIISGLAASSSSSNRNPIEVVINMDSRTVARQLVDPMEDELKRKEAGKKRSKGIR